MKQKLGHLYATLMAIYFLTSGLSVLFDISGKLERIDLKALSSDGEIAFLLIYTGLMVGIGVASLAMQFISKSWIYPALLSTIIIGSFVLFRIVGSIMVGSLSTTQIGFLSFELVEVSAGILLLRKEKFRAS